ncbi:hypothetical protein GCM10007868_07170 [Gluconobacter frateurii]|nr:hypothetical protein GCM10007868_07170 [Gluconobacter frateurii]
MWGWGVCVDYEKQTDITWSVERIRLDCHELFVFQIQCQLRPLAESIEPEIRKREILIFKEHGRTQS